MGFIAYYTEGKFKTEFFWTTTAKKARGRGLGRGVIVH